jgi:hypothetical protein
MGEGRSPKLWIVAGYLAEMRECSLTENMSMVLQRRYFPCGLKINLPDRLVEGRPLENFESRPESLESHLWSCADYVVVPFRKESNSPRRVERDGSEYRAENYEREVCMSLIWLGLCIAVLYISWKKKKS